MTESDEKLIEVMAEDYDMVLQNAKSMGCNNIRALYNIPLKNMELIIQALEKQIPKKAIITGHNNSVNTDVGHCPICDDAILRACDCTYCPDCGQRLEW